MEIMKRSLFILVLTVGVTAQGQGLTEYNTQKNTISKRGMLFLGAWGLGNAAAGGIGWASSNDPQMQAFHQMNLLWGAVNLGLAIPSYIGAAKDDPSAMDTRKSYSAQIKKEKLFLANTAFDLVYVSSGIFMRERAKWDLANTERLNGWGTSFIIQGSFLFAFDFAMTMIHNTHRKKKFEPMINISATRYGMGLRWVI